ncbi:hypothetical protein L4D09_08725 [Photobacterium makurazakiensis]|uniref:hypothetical protein n=1 Tax=Photobacterium makurazakiensis TaxID=2910234 RepID=UPI003D0AE4DE
MYLEEHYYSFSIVTEFIQDIGLTIIEKKQGETSTESHCWIKAGRIYFQHQPNREVKTGEILFMAALIAITPEEERFRLSCAKCNDNHDNMMALAWCWAAIHHLELSIDILLYSFSNAPCYQVLERWSECRFLGVPLLQNVGMTVEPTCRNVDSNTTFPKMLRWVRG